MKTAGKVIKRVSAVAALAWVLVATLGILRDCPLAGPICEPRSVMLIAGGLPLGLMLLGNLVGWAMERMERTPMVEPTPPPYGVRRAPALKGEAGSRGAAASPGTGGGGAGASASSLWPTTTQSRSAATPR